MELATALNGWVNSVDSRSSETLEKAHRILSSNIYCTLSTCSADGYPWVSPVFFTYDDDLSIYWASTVVSKHSQNIYSNHGRVAIAIFNSSVAEGTGEGLYFYGTASELDPRETERAMKLLFARAQKQPSRRAEDYLNASPRRIYYFQPQEAWITGTRLPIGNQLVDTKIQINVSDLKNKAYGINNLT